MNDFTHRILLVEDELELREMIRAILEEQQYQVIAAENGQQAIEALNASERKFSLILSDIIMPEMDGYELCEHVKNEEATQNTRFIFLSSLSTLEEKIKGYNAGGDDYITKPIAMEELAYKVKRALDSTAKAQQLLDQLSYSNGAAMEAITYSSDLGQILEFYKQSLRAKDFHELASHVFNATQAMGLEATIQIYSPDQVIALHAQGAASPLESNVIELARKKSRFFDFGARTIVNYQDFSLLIKNMPLDRPQRYGTVKDSLGGLCDAIEAGVKAIQTDREASKKSDILKTVQRAIDDTKATFGTLQKDNMAAIEEMMEEIEEAFLSLGLSEPQEDKLRHIVENHMNKTNAAFYKGLNVNEKFEDIKTKLKEILS